MIWSADGRRLGFFVDGKLKTLEVSGGPARVVADAPANWWSRLEPRGDLPVCARLSPKACTRWRPQAETPVSVLKLDLSQIELIYGMPTFLPDGKHFLLITRAANDPASSGTYFASMDGKENRLLLKGARRPHLWLGIFALPVSTKF